MPGPARQDCKAEHETRGPNKYSVKDPEASALLFLVGN
jgi:hypothetical protein